MDLSHLRALCWARRMARAGHGTTIRTLNRRIAAEKKRLQEGGVDPFYLHAFVIAHTRWNQQSEAVKRARRYLEEHAK